MTFLLSIGCYVDSLTSTSVFGKFSSCHVRIEPCLATHASFYGSTSEINQLHLRQSQGMSLQSGNAFLQFYKDSTNLFQKLAME